MNDRIKEELGGLFARLSDLSRRAGQGVLCDTPFLSPREQHYAGQYLAGCGVEIRLFGGYAEAERKKLYLLPDYMSGREEEIEELLASYGQSTGIAVLTLKGSGYRTLAHRDFLGALLHLGLERGVLGDIAVNEAGDEALLFCEEAMAEFICSELSRAGSDRLRPCRARPGQWQVPPRRYAPLTDTVASPRLDGIVAALCGVAREKAAGLVSSGRVELNYEQEERPDKTVHSPSLISVRGYGKFRILSVDEPTKKGCLRLRAEKFL